VGDWRRFGGDLEANCLCCPAKKNHQTDGRRNKFSEGTGHQREGEGSAPTGWTTARMKVRGLGKEQTLEINLRWKGW